MKYESFNGYYIMQHTYDVGVTKIAWSSNEHKGWCKIGHYVIVSEL